MNPYRGTHFFSFFGELAHNFWLLISGNKHALAADELQLLVLSGMAISAALVGCLLVLRRITMLANSLSHTILLGVIVAHLILPDSWIALLIGSCCMGVVTTFLTTTVSGVTRLKQDAANGLIFTTLFAVGILLVTLYTRNSHISAEVVMGNADGLHRRDLWLVGFTLALNLVLTILFFRPYLVSTFDSGFARSLGISTIVFNYLLMTQVSATAIAGFRAVGVLMVLAFLVGLPLAARQLTRSLSSMMLVASLLGVVASCVGVALSRHLLTVYNWPLSTGGLVVCMIGVEYCIILGYTKLWRIPIRLHKKVV